MSACIPNIDIPIASTSTVSANIEIKVEHANDDQKDTIDILELACLLQCLGFSLQSFDKEADAGAQPSSLCDDSNGYLHINLTCAKSQMKAVLVKQQAGCKCPSNEDASNAQFWNISACSPSLPGHLTVSKSSLIPAIPVDKFQDVKYLLLKAINIINAQDNKKTESFADLFRTSSTLARPKSLDNIKNDSKDENLESHGLSPRKTSSPMSDAADDPKSIFIDSEKASKLIETFRVAEKILTDAFHLNKRNSTFTKRGRRLSDLKISPLTSEDHRSANSSSLSLSKPDSSSCKITPKKLVPKKNLGTIGDKRKLQIPPSKIGVLKQKKVESPSRLLALKKETPSRSLMYKDKPTNINLSKSKIKTTPKCDSLTKIRMPSKIASLSSNKNVKL